MKKIVGIVVLTLVILSGCGKEKTPVITSEEQPQIENENVKPPEKKKVLPVSNIAELGERQEAKLIPYLNKVYYAGGYNNSDTSERNFNDIWVTEDFINWFKLTDEASIPYGYYKRSAIVDEKIIIFHSGNWKEGDSFVSITKDGMLIKEYYPAFKDIIKADIDQYYFDNFDHRLYYNPYLRWIDKCVFLTFFVYNFNVPFRNRSIVSQGRRPWFLYPRWGLS